MKKLALAIILIITQQATGDLIAHWKLNDNADSAVVLDATGNYVGTYKDKDGDLKTNTGASTGKIGGALSFDGRQAGGGTDEYVDTGDTFQSTFQGSFSISLWAKPTDGQPEDSGFFFGVATALEENCVWIVHGSNGGVYFTYTSNDNKATRNPTSAQLADGQESWHHIVMVVDSTIRAMDGVKGYFDGKLMSRHATLFTGNTTDVVSADYSSTSNPFIGAESHVGMENPSNSLIDNVMLFDTVLSKGEIEILHHGTEIAAELDEQILPRRGNLSRFPLRRRYEY